MDEITAKNLKAISAELKKPAEPAHKFTITHKKEIEVSPVPPTTNIAHHAAANNFLLPAKPNNHQILTAAPQSIRPIRVGSTAVNVKSARPMVMSTYFAPQFQNAAKPSNFESSNLSLEVIPPVMDVHGGIQYENATAVFDTCEEYFRLAIAAKNYNQDICAKFLKDCEEDPIMKKLEKTCKSMIESCARGTHGERICRVLETYCGRAHEGIIEPEHNIQSHWNSINGYEYDADGYAEVFPKASTSHDLETIDPFTRLAKCNMFRDSIMNIASVIGLAEVDEFYLLCDGTQFWLELNGQCREIIELLQSSQSIDNKDKIVALVPAICSARDPKSMLKNFSTQTKKSVGEMANLELTDLKGHISVTAAVASDFAQYSTNCEKHFMIMASNKLVNSGIALTFMKICSASEWFERLHDDCQNEIATCANVANPNVAELLEACDRIQTICLENQATNEKHRVIDFVDIGLPRIDLNACVDLYAVVLEDKTKQSADRLIDLCFEVHPIVETLLSVSCVDEIYND